MLWECSECGESTTDRPRVCPNCGMVTRYVRADTAADSGREIGSLREYWVSAGAERWKAPAPWR